MDMVARMHGNLLLLTAIHLIFKYKIAKRYNWSKITLKAHSENNASSYLEPEAEKNAVL